MSALVFGTVAVRPHVLPGTGIPVTSSSVPLDASEAEARARAAYSLIGDEYYDAFHLTSRNFEESISGFLAEHPLDIRRGSRYLEVGCGRSRLNRVRHDGSQFVLLDLCERMLQHSLADGVGPGSTPLLGSAFALPFRNETFRTVFAFLGDPFFHPDYLDEVRRVLIPGGSILQIVPSHDWGATLRASRGAPIHLSHFFRGSREAFGPSFLLPKSEISRALNSAGFNAIRIGDLFLPQSIQPEFVSPDILVPAALRSVGAHGLPILNVIQATMA
jgi:SAM-dependent methyltransferase